MKASAAPARGALRAWHVALLYTALTAVLAYPLVRHAAGHVLSVSPDTDLFLWTLSWDVHALAHQPLSIFDANIFAPLPRTLAYSEHLIGSGVLAAPVLVSTHNPVLAMNLVALLSCILCGLGTFLLARRAGVASAGAVLAGLIFAFAPPRFLRLDQLFLTTIQWMPFSLAYLHAYLDDGEKRHLRLAAAFFTLQALTSGHGTVFLALAAALLCGYRASLGEPLAIGRRLRDLGVSGALLLTPIALMAVAYVRVQGEMGLKRTLADWVVTRPASFLASPAYVHAYLLARLFPGSPINGEANAYLFPGYIPLLLAAAALVAGARSSASTRASSTGSTGVYALLVLSCVWLAAGPPFGIWPLVYWLPGLNFIRAASRFMLPALLGLSVLAGIGFDWLTRRLRRPAQIGVATAVGALLVAEFAVPLTTTPYAVVTPPADRWLARQAVPFTVAEVPLPPLSHVYEFEKRQAEFMLHSAEHWQKTVHGWSGLQPPAHLALYDRLTRFPDDDSLRALADFHVDYLVVHTDLYTAGEWEAVERRLAAYQGRMELRHADGTGRVYALTTPHARLDTPSR